MKKYVILPFIIFIKLYRMILSPLLMPNCRFQPTCSQYTLDALNKYGLFKGGMLSLKRMLRCNPWGKKKGYDPVP